MTELARRELRDGRVVCLEKQIFNWRVVVGDGQGVDDGY